MFGLLVALVLAVAAIDWRRRARQLKLEGALYGAAWRLHCVDHRLADAIAHRDALERRRYRLIEKIENRNQLCFPFEVSG